MRADHTEGPGTESSDRFTTGNRARSRAVHPGPAMAAQRGRPAPSERAPGTAKPLHKQQTDSADSLRTRQSAPRAGASHATAATAACGSTAVAAGIAVAAGATQHSRQARTPRGLERYHGGLLSRWQPSSCRGPKGA